MNVLNSALVAFGVALTILIFAFGVRRLRLLPAGGGGHPGRARAGPGVPARPGLTAQSVTAVSSRGPASGRMLKKSERSTNRATNISTTPASTMPSIDQRCDAGASISDLTTM